MENDDVIEVYQEQTGGLPLFTLMWMLMVANHEFPTPRELSADEFEE